MTQRFMMWSSVMEQGNYNYHKTNKTMQNINNNVGGYTTVSPPESRRLAGFP